jgi:hypothetical protein
MQKVTINGDVYEVSGVMYETLRALMSLAEATGNWREVQALAERGVTSGQVKRGKKRTR